MAFKRKGIVARPGTYKYGDREEYKSAEDLERISKTQPTLMLTLGHPKDGFPSERDYLGTVATKWDSEKQILTGDFWFYDEYFEKLPKLIRDKIVNSQEVSISTGFKLDGIEDGVQKGALYSHVAILIDEDPLCPLGSCGINVRQESEDLSTYRYEEKSEITEPSAKEEPKLREVTGLEELRAEVSQLTQLVKTLVSPPKPVAVQEPEPEKAPVEEVATVQPDPVPEKVIPAGTSSDDEIEMVDGWMKLS